MVQTKMEQSVELSESTESNVLEIEAYLRNLSKRVKAVNLAEN